MRFRLGTSTPRGTVGCATLPFRVGFRLLLRPPRPDGSMREWFDFGFPRLRACVLLQFAFLRLAPPATPTIRGTVLTVVGLAIAPSRLAPRHTGGTRQLLTDGLLPYSVCVSFKFSSRFSWLHSQAVQRCGSGFEEPHLRFMV